MCLPDNSYVESQTLKVTVIGDRAFREVIKVRSDHKGGVLTPLDWCLIRRGRDTRDLLLTKHTHTRKATWGHCKKATVYTQEQNLHQTPAMTACWTWTSGRQKYEKMNVCCLSHAVCSTLLGQPKQTDILQTKASQNLFSYKVKFRNEKQIKIWSSSLSWATTLHPSLEYKTKLIPHPATYQITFPYKPPHPLEFP